ncbi:hypothetical protein [Patulibacter sp.]|uniref:phage baseplate protein n=1 Tax=Patulibacter sp. TaxID=1912859 RepID=UPI00271F66C4|nr:hypothetical protein [Patulibacter sp.]MDO9410417.1 hypothetical protein [Patulibacter sp.]
MSPTRPVPRTPRPRSRPGRAALRPGLAALVTAVALGVPASASAGPLLPAGTFDPAAPSSYYPQLLDTPLKGSNAMQGFAFDEQAQQIYVLQTVTGEKEQGNLWLNRLTYSGKLVDSMKLEGFGHGVSMGLHDHGGAVWVFVESESKSSGGEDGKGSRVARVVYHGGTTVRSGTSAALDVTPPGTANNAPRPTVDPVTGQLVVRYGERPGVWGFKRVPIEDAVVGRWDRLVTLGTTPTKGEPRPGNTSEEVVSQGYAFAGETAYLYYGDSYDHVGKPGDAYVRFVPMRATKLVRGTIGGVKVLPDMSFREPEGIAVQVNPGGPPRLVFGLASDPVTKPDETRRFANFAYQEGFLPGPVPEPEPAPEPVPAPAPAPPPVAAPAPAATIVLRAKRVNRNRVVRTRRIPISIGGADVAAEVRVYAKFGRRLSRIYRATRTVRTAQRTVTLRISRAQARRLRRSSGRVRLTISARVAGQPTKRRHVTIPRRR